MAIQREQKNPHKMLHLIAEAGEGEIAQDHNDPGDQIGVELRARDWYWYGRSELGWATVFRVEDAAIAEKIAQFMERIITNGYVGYDQSNRDTIDLALTQLRYDPRAIHFPVETDCSLTAFEAVRCATGIPCDTHYSGPAGSNALPSSRDPKTGLCGDTYFSSRNSYPTGANLHYYMCRVLPLNGIKVSAITLYGYKDGEIRSDFYPQNMYQLYNSDDGEYVVTSAGRRIDYSAQRWKARYYDTPYQYLGITKSDIDNAPDGIISGYTQTINGVKYYNEFGRAVDSYNLLYNSKFESTKAANAEGLANFQLPGTRTYTENGVTKTETINVNLEWKEIKPYNALTYEQVVRLAKNISSTSSNANESGYLLPDGSSKYPTKLKRGDVIISRIGFSGASTVSGRVHRDGKTYTVTVPRVQSAGHCVVWI